jgi:hypothetical protein
MMDYLDFSRGPARRVFAGLGADWSTLLDHARSFEGLRSAVVARNDEYPGCFVIAVRSYAGTASGGERSLLLAVCTLCDFAHVADKLSEQHQAWQNIVSGCDHGFRAAVATCIEAAP